MVIFTFLFLIAEGITMLSRAVPWPYIWAPILTVLVVIAFVLYDWSRRWIANRESSQHVDVRVQTIPKSEGVEENNN